MSNYAEECLKKYVKTRETLKIRIRFEIYPSQILIYYYLQQHNMHLKWKTYANTGTNNVTEPNDSKIFFNRLIKRLTRLDIKKR